MVFSVFQDTRARIDFLNIVIMKESAGVFVFGFFGFPGKSCPDF